MSRANIEIEGDFAVSGKESIPVEFLKGDTSTAHLTQLGSMSLPDTSMAGDLLITVSSRYGWGFYIICVGMAFGQAEYTVIILCPSRRRENGSVCRFSPSGNCA